MTGESGQDAESSTKEKCPERPLWSNSLEFLMSCISVSVGLGNVWRFPFVAYENGGGAFLIPYLTVLFLIGKPMYYLEMMLGQFTAGNSVKIYNFCPAFRGAGVGQMFGSMCIITYYCPLIATTLFYLIASFRANLPWSKCLDEWPNCVDSKPNPNITLAEKGISSAELYFLRIVSKDKDNLSDGIGLPDWKLSLCLFFSWVVIFVVIVRGVRSSGKAAYFLALFPYVILIALLIRAVTLDGAIDGIIFFIRPQWGELLNPKVWKEAIVQLFFSLAVGLGPIIVFASYNSFRHNIYRDAMIVTTLDTVTSLISGFTIFGILGNLAKNLNIKNIDEVVKSGTGLAFISYPDAIAKFDFAPQVFSVLFFFMLFILGVGSEVALQITLTTMLSDRFPSFKFWKISIFTCCGGFLLGLVYVTPGGQWMLNLVDHYGATLLVFFLAIFELFAIFWIYGIENFSWDLEFMTGRKTTLYWRICWTIVTPGLMLIVFVYSMANYKRLQYGGVDYPDALIAIGWILFGFGVSQIVFFGVNEFIKNSKPSKCDQFLALFKPNENWGPIDPETKVQWIRFKKEALEKRIKMATTLNHPPWKQKLYILLGKYD